MEIIRNINGTNFHLHNLVNFSYERFYDVYITRREAAGELRVKWDPKETWAKIQEEMKECGLIGNDSELKHRHKK